MGEAADRYTFPGVLSVPAFDGDGLVRGRPILFTAEDQPFQLRQHNYHYWADSPSQLLQRALVAYLTRLRIAKAVVTPAMRVNADFELRGRITRLERILGTEAPRVAVQIEMTVVRLSDGKFLMSGSYAAELPSGDNTVSASVRALNQATARVFKDFRKDATRSLQAALRSAP